MENFDVVVIGSGPGGYSAAIRCAQKGVSVAVIEKAEIGGTCLNCGCIPSKALLGSAYVLLTARNAALMGINVASCSPNWQKMQTRKDSIVAGFRKGLAGLIQSHKVRIFQGRGIVINPQQVKVESAAGTTDIAVRRGIILATGSEPINISAFPFDAAAILSSKEVLSLKGIPQSMVIIGGGVIGCELACVYSAVGTKVTIVEALPRLLNKEDAWVSQMLERELKKLGVDILTGQKVISVDTSSPAAKVVLESRQVINAEKVLVSVGRKSVCDSETVESLRMAMNGSAIKVSEKMQTNVPGVYAIGDAVGTTYLAHGAFAEAEVAAENITGGNARMDNYSLIPRAVYTFPEVASVGKTEQQCIDAGVDVMVGRAFFKANGRSVAHNETTGEIRVVREKGSDKILGIAMVGSAVTELISSARLLIGSKEKCTEVSFPHPTVSEVLKEAWEDAFDMSLHNPPKTP